MLITQNTRIPLRATLTPEVDSSVLLTLHDPRDISLLRSRFIGMPRNAPPKETAAHNRTTFLSIVSVVWLRSIEKTNHITAKCE